MTDCTITFDTFKNLIDRLCKEEDSFILQVITFEAFTSLAKKVDLHYTFSSIFTIQKAENTLNFIIDDCACVNLPKNSKIIFYSTNIYTQYPKVILIDESKNKSLDNYARSKIELIPLNADENELLILFLVHNNDNKLKLDEIRLEAMKINEQFENASLCFKVICSLERKRYIVKAGKRYKINISKIFLERLLSKIS